MAKPAVLIFGLGFLQRSLIEQCKSLGLFTVGIDITPDAECRNEVDAFEVAAGDDYETTLAVAKKHSVSGVITAATDKPLVMMAKVAEALNLPFVNTRSAEWSTDKLQMKQRFQEYGVPCAQGIELRSAQDLDAISWEYPIIVKPRDNSGSRGVIFCQDRESADAKIRETFENTRKDTILVEEYIDGQEYSIESLHYRGKTHVVQFTQKITTEFPYNVELGHIQPADLTTAQEEDARNLVGRIAEALQFDNCAAHTELKIGSRGITVIETSPRLGGDFITSKLTPLSTGVNLEQLLIKMSIGAPIEEDAFTPTSVNSSGVVFFELPNGTIAQIRGLDGLREIDGYIQHEFTKHPGDTVETITSSLDRYGYAIFKTNDRTETELAIELSKQILRKAVVLE